MAQVSYPSSTWELRAVLSLAALVFMLINENLIKTNFILIIFYLFQFSHAGERFYNLMCQPLCKKIF